MKKEPELTVEVNPRHAHSLSPEQLSDLAKARETFEPQPLPRVYEADDRVKAVAGMRRATAHRGRGRASLLRRGKRGAWIEVAPRVRGDKQARRLARRVIFG